MITGLGRCPEDYDIPEETHLYTGDFGQVGWPMCPRGWNRDHGTGFSIFRNNIGDGGVCPECERRARLGLKPIPPMINDLESTEYSALPDDFEERATRSWRRLYFALKLNWVVAQYMDKSFQLHLWIWNIRHKPSERI